jgi:amidase
MVPAGHATDGLGSIRIPASCCGLVGLKPTHDFLPAGDHWNGLSHAGFVTRTVRDTAMLLDATAQPDPGLVRAVDAGSGPLRVAVSVKAPTPTPVKRVVRAAVDRAAAVLRDLGHTVEDRKPPYGPGVVMSNVGRYFPGVAADLDALTDPNATERRTRAMAAIGRRISPSRMEAARATGRAFAEEMAGFFADVDLLLIPTMPVLPRKAGCLAHRGTVRTVALMLPCQAFTGPWNAAGLPALSLPVGTTDDGLPVGVQLVGPAGSEGRLLAVAAGIERVVGWPDRRVDEERAFSSLP